MFDCERDGSSGNRVLGETFFVSELNRKTSEEVEEDTFTIEFTFCTCELSSGQNAFKVKHTSGDRTKKMKLINYLEKKTPCEKIVYFRFRVEKCGLFQRSVLPASLS